MIELPQGNGTSFSYQVTPDVVPCTEDSHAPSKVDLQIGVFNGTQDDISCASLVFTLKGGLAEGHASAVQGTSWSIEAGDQAGTFVAQPKRAPVLPAGTGLAFVLSQVRVDETPGVAGISVDEGTDPPGHDDLTLAKVKQKLAITSFTATPGQTTPRAEVVLAWTTVGANEVTLSGKTVALKGQQPVYPERTTTYTLMASGSGPPVIAQITVYVLRADILYFRAAPESVAKGGGSTLSWRALDTARCMITPGIGDVPPEDSVAVQVAETTKYELYAYGLNDSSTAYHPRPVTVENVIIDKFQAAPQQIALGASVTLEWSTKWTSARRIEPDPGAVDEAGSTAVEPEATTTYKLTAEGQNPLASEQKVEVMDVEIHQFTATPDHIGAGGKSTLAWGTAWAMRCYLLQDGEFFTDVDLSGSLEVGPPQTTVYTLVTEGQNALTRDVKVYVDSGAVGPAP
jgi:hypothetical protein